HALCEGGRDILPLRRRGRGPLRAGIRTRPAPFPHRTEAWTEPGTSITISFHAGPIEVNLEEVPEMPRDGSTFADERGRRVWARQPVGATSITSLRPSSPIIV